MSDPRRVLHLQDEAREKRAPRIMRENGSRLSPHGTAVCSAFAADRRQISKIELVPLAGLAFTNISKGLDCQTALRGSIGPQRISGAVSNHHQRRRLESPQNQIYVVPQNQAQAMSANTESKTAPKVINGRINGRFAPGVSGNPGGSPEATRRAFNKRFLTDLARDWEQHGPEVFKRVRRESPASYLKVCAMLVPKELKFEHSGGVKAMTDEQLERSIEILRELIAKREAEENAKVIAGVGEPVPALPPPSHKARRKMRRSDRADSGLAARVVDAEPTDEVGQPPRSQV